MDSKTQTLFDSEEVKKVPNKNNVLEEHKETLYCKSCKVKLRTFICRNKCCSDCHDLLLCNCGREEY